MPTGKQYAEEAYKIYKTEPKPGYIYGTMGKLWTEADQKALEKKYYSDPVKYKDLELGAKYGKKWIGHRVWDCSGLTADSGRKVGLNYHHGSNSSYRYDCKAQGAKTATTKLPPGAWVYTGTPSNRGHIGVVFDDEWVIEAQGTKAGVVMSKLSLKKWTWWGLGKGLTFDFLPGIESKPVEALKPEVPIVKIPKTVRRGDRGEEVRKLQTLLAKDGSSLAIDGIFGPGTQSAVRSFQKRHGLVVDGIVGPKTWGELLKLQ